jgi:hypothetical protein
MDISPGLEDRNCGIGISRDHNLMAGVLQFRPDDFPNQSFIFNDKDRCHFHEGPKNGSARKFNYLSGLFRRSAQT